VSLLREIQTDAVSSTGDVAALLRKCKILAARLGNTEFKAWVDAELNGYESVESLPEYRRLSVESVGHFNGPYGSGIKNAPIPPSCIPKVYRHLITHSQMAQPISHYSSLLQRQKKGGTFQETWPSDLVVRVGKGIYENMHCVSAWKVIPFNSIAALVDTIRTRILNFCLEIEAEDPNAGEAPLNNPPLPQEKVTQVFNTFISGSVQNVATGSTDFKQHASSGVTADEILSKLVTALKDTPEASPGREELIASANVMREAAGTGSFADRYTAFMSVLSDHIQVYGPICAPYLPLIAAIFR
jgi:hypothetical protein